MFEICTLFGQHLAAALIATFLMSISKVQGLEKKERNSERKISLYVIVYIQFYSIWIDSLIFSQPSPEK